MNSGSAITDQQPPRRHGGRADTRQHLLDTAGEIFAERGYDAVKGQEICLRAGVNGAAINYHFGGMERLYEAVLREARGRMPSAEALLAAAPESAEPEVRLRALLALVIATVTGPTSKTWVLRLLGREAIAPSPIFQRLLLEPELLPKIAVLKSIIAGLTGLPVGHPAVARGCLSVFAPCQMMLLASPLLFQRGYPEISLDEPDAQAMLDHLTAFSLGGLAAIAAREASRSVFG
ncbi:MAG: CerR family C-terminal domain-containing protein [Caulobacteraceae bacterium]|nr:CerR family C-terminal domain-containing protein [Caulobacteraceae bacterium]